MSRIRTLAPRPAATLAALEPTTPPPRMATSAGATPGTPESRMPRPSCGRSRYLAPSWMLIRPATSLIGVSSGQAAPRVAQRLVGDGRDPAVDDRRGEPLVGGEVEVGEERLAGPQVRPLRRLRLLDLDHQVGRRPDLGGLGHDRRPGRLVLGVGDPAPQPGARLDQDGVAGLGQLLGPDREHRHPILVRLDLPAARRRSSAQSPTPVATARVSPSCPTPPGVDFQQHSIRHGRRNQVAVPGSRWTPVPFSCPLPVVDRHCRPSRDERRETHEWRGRCGISDARPSPVLRPRPDRARGRRCRPRRRGGPCSGWSGLRRGGGEGRWRRCPPAGSRPRPAGESRGRSRAAAPGPLPRVPAGSPRRSSPVAAIRSGSRHEGRSARLSAPIRKNSSSPGWSRRMDSSVSTL